MSNISLSSVIESTSNCLAKVGNQINSSKWLGRSFKVEGKDFLVGGLILSVLGLCYLGAKKKISESCNVGDTTSSENSSESLLSRVKNWVQDKYSKFDAIDKIFPDNLDYEGIKRLYQDLGDKDEAQRKCN